VNPLQARVSSPPTWRVTVATICGVWIVAALFALPTAVSKYLCENFVSKRMAYYKQVVIFELLEFCLLPLCVIAFSYIMTAHHLVGSSRSMSEGTQSRQLKTRINTAKVVVGLTLVFLISYVPYHVLWAYYICTTDVLYYFQKYMFHFNYSSFITGINLLSVDKLEYPYLISTCFLLINSCLNPVALFCTSSPFRQHLKRYLTCYRKTNSNPSVLELAIRN
jgi:hypothetical protein